MYGLDELSDSVFGYKNYGFLHWSGSCPSVIPQKYFSQFYVDDGKITYRAINEDDFGPINEKIKDTKEFKEYLCAFITWVKSLYQQYKLDTVQKDFK